MMRRNNIRENLHRIGRLAGLNENETIASIKTRRQMLIAAVVVAIGVLTLQIYYGTGTLKYTGMSINDFSWFWGMT